MKKAFILAAIMIAAMTALTGCGENKQSQTETTSPAATVVATKQETETVKEETTVGTTAMLTTEAETSVELTTEVRLNPDGSPIDEMTGRKY